MKVGDRVILTPPAGWSTAVRVNTPANGSEGTVVDIKDGGRSIAVQFELREDYAPVCWLPRYVLTEKQSDKTAEVVRGRLMFAIDSSACTGCAFQAGHDCHLIPCESHTREDGRSVIYVEPGPDDKEYSSYSDVEPLITQEQMRAHTDAIRLERAVSAVKGAPVGCTLLKALAEIKQAADAGKYWVEGCCPLSKAEVDILQDLGYVVGPSGESLPFNAYDIGW